MSLFYSYHSRRMSFSLSLVVNLLRQGKQTVEIFRGWFSSFEVFFFLSIQDKQTNVFYLIKQTNADMICE